jgi:hypothetical protein
MKENRLKIDVKETGLDSSGSGQEPEAGSCELGNELLGSLKC